MTAARRARWPFMVWLTVVSVMLIGGGAYAGVKLTASPPRAGVRIDAPATLVLDGQGAVPIPVPTAGSFALSTSTVADVASHNATVERPIGSVAKAMAALVVLEAEPLPAGAGGPSITMTAADVALYHQAVAEGGSNLAVRAGEVLSERDLLLALLLPSADNIAETLAVWVSGNRTTFIARENAMAAAMGMDHTHFADPSGLSPKTESTAADLLILARAVTASPALADLVAVQEARLPDGTLLHNLDILLGHVPGWLGVKTGWTGAAGGCLLFAARRSYGPASNVSVTVWGAVLGQPKQSATDRAHPELGGAFAAAQNAVSAALGDYVAVDIDHAVPPVTGTVITAWADTTDVQLVSNLGHLWVPVMPGAALHLTVTRLPPLAPFARGAIVGRVTGVLNATTSVTWQVAATAAINGPSAAWKLVH
jgi:D-alanyl-D-alanine carboxypeptidase (penicillin-binding protein 5/6)